MCYLFLWRTLVVLTSLQLRNCFSSSVWIYCQVSENQQIFWRIECVCILRIFTYIGEWLVRSMWRWLEASALISNAEDQTPHWTVLAKPSMENNLILYCWVTTVSRDKLWRWWKWASSHWLMIKVKMYSSKIKIYAAKICDRSLLWRGVKTCKWQHKVSNQVYLMKTSCEEFPFVCNFVLVYNGQLYKAGFSFSITINLVMLNF